MEDHSIEVDAGIEEVANEIRVAVFEAAIKRVIDGALGGPVRLQHVDRGGAGHLARGLGEAYRQYGLSLWPRVHIAVQPRLSGEELYIAYIKVRTGESLTSGVSGLIAICEPSRLQAWLDETLDDQMGRQPVRWCTCGHEAKPEAGHEEDCPLAPFETSRS